MDLTQQEFDDYAAAFNVLRNTTTADGRAKYGHQCLDNDTDFHTHDAFVALHHFSSTVRNHSRVHYLWLQEVAHLAWMALFQKALRCVCPSCAQPYFDPVHDYDLHRGASVADLVRNSPMWSNLRYGGADNHDLRSDDPAFVKDGRFAHFEITQTQNASYWCDPLVELSGDMLYRTCMDAWRPTKCLKYSKRCGNKKVQDKSLA